jgi:hypothetical protein
MVAVQRCTASTEKRRGAEAPPGKDTGTAQLPSAAAGPNLRPASVILPRQGKLRVPAAFSRRARTP